MRGAQFLTCWAIVVQHEGRDLGDGQLSAAVAEYAAWWKDSERTAWRHLAAFRKSYPGHDDPAELARELAPKLAKTADTVRKADAAIGALRSTRPDKSQASVILHRFLASRIKA